MSSAPSRFRLRAASLALVSGVAAAAPSQAVPSGPEAPPEPTPQCRSANALSAIACELSLGLPAELGHVAVASAPVVGAAGDRQGELAARLAHVVAGRFVTATPLGARSLGAARTQPGSFDQVLYLTPRLNGAHLEVTADLYPLARGFWARFKAAPGPLAHAFASRRIDGEIGSFLPIPKLLGKVEAKATLPTEVVAVACGDVDGDRGLELVLSGRRDLYVGRLAAGAFVPSQKVAWQTLSPVAPAPLRQPIATLHVQPGQALVAGTTDRRDLVYLGPELEVLRRVPGRLPIGDLGCVERRGLGVGPVVMECDGERAFERAEAAELDGVAGATLHTPSGSTRVLATRAVGSDVLELQDGDGRRARLAGAGAQLAIADLNHDGTLEVISSRDGLSPESDGLRVHGFLPEGLSPLYELPVPRGIDALAACPSEDAGAAFIVVATGRELWLVR